MTIESKEQSRLWHAFLAREIAAFSHFEIRVPLNGAQTGHTRCCQKADCERGTLEYVLVRGADALEDQLPTATW